MPRAYDRVKNANNVSDVFIRTEYWTNDIEDHFQVWRANNCSHSLEELCDLCLGAEVGVSFKALEGSTCCTLAHQPSKESGLPYLLTGWSDNSRDAIAVAMYKLEVLLKGIWEAPPQRPVPRRR